ncbi:RNA-directed DNA polymerase, eukaryota [Tanacetum coccineum]
MIMSHEKQKNFIRLEILDQATRKNASPGTVSNSFAAVLKSGSVNHNTVTESSPAIVLDDACIMERDFSCSLMGKMKDINALSNLFIILANEGFENVKLFYLGGQWVLLELDSVTSKEKITNHVGVGSWFEVLKPACNSFVCEELLVNPKPNCNTVISKDPFGIYKILKRNKDANVTEDNIPGNASQPKLNPTTSGNKELASSVNDKFQACGHYWKTGLIDLPLEGYSFTWAHKSASKMSKLDRFLISEGLLALFPSISALCLDKHLSDHRPILLRELNVDYGPMPFRFFHSWSSYKGFDKMVEDSWKNSVYNQKSNEHKRNIQNSLIILDKIFDQGSCNDDLIHERLNLLKELQDFNKSSSLDMA